ncbi:MAG: M23 family metallopeptidase [Clostridiales bacterium]|nr:M23 family metallopeptidase [Clostridiales bacterium]
MLIGKGRENVILKWLLCLPLLATLLLFSGCDWIQSLSIGKLEGVRILVPEEYALDDERLVQIAEEDELTAITAALKTGDITANAVSGQPYQVTLNYQRAAKEYEVYVNDDAAVFSFGGKTYSVAEENAGPFLALPVFTGRYIAPLLTPLEVSAGEESFSLLPQSYAINVAAPSGNKSRSSKEKYTNTALPTITDLNDITIIGAPIGSTLAVTYHDNDGNHVDDLNEAGTYSCAAVVGLESGEVSGTLSYRFDFIYTPPFSAIISSDSVEQSGSFAVLLNNADPALIYTLRTDFKENGIAFSPLENGRQIALAGIISSQKTGEYLIEVLADSEVVADFPLEVKKKDFPRQDLTVTVQQQAIRTDPGNAQSDAEKVNAAKSAPEPALLCDGTFIMPCQGRISTQYGEERYINGTFSNRHSGVDIAAKTDTPILAMARGKVVFADELIISGNTVIIDHGAGMFSSYCHQNKFNCSVGDIVEQGETIGYVGSTGFATGPHLHWGMTLHGTYINPMALVENSQILAVLK